MAKQMLFSFELEPGMVVFDDVLDDTGRLIIPKGSVLDDDTISKLEFFNIDEVPICEDPKELEVVPEEEIHVDYATKVKNSDDYKHFLSSYKKIMNNLKSALDNLAAFHTPVDSEKFIKDIFAIIDECQTTSQILDLVFYLPPNDDQTYRHSLNVAIISTVLGKWIGLRQADLQILTLSALLHDVGKVTVSTKLLDKTGKLTDDEFTKIKNHVMNGYRILSTQPTLDKRIIATCLTHHERCDGSGYPNHLTGDKIPAFGKIVAIADSYEAMTATRTYRQGLCPFEVLRILDSDGLSKFDPSFFMTFTKNITSTYLHYDVTLSDGRTGEIIMINDKCLYRPIIKCEEEYVDLMKEPDIKIVKIGL